MEANTLMLNLPQLSRTELALHNAIACHAGWSITFAGNDWHLQCVAATENVETTTQLNLRVDAEPCSIKLKDRWLQTLLADYLKDEALADLPNELALVVLETALAPLLKPIEQALDADITLVSEQLDNSPQAVIQIGLQAQSATGQTDAGQLALSKSLAARLSTLLHQQPSKPPQTWPELPIPIQLQCAYTELDLNTLHDLASGDLILLDRGPWLKAPALIVRISPTLAYRANVENDQIILQAQELSMNEASDTNPTELTDLAELPVKLSFELAELNVPLAELQNLQVGHTFELPSRPEQAVNICANGRCIGVGELVQIDQHLGVRVVQLHTAQ